MVTTEGDGDAERAAATAAAAGRGAIFVAGGDGTVNEAVNGVASAGATNILYSGTVTPNINVSAGVQPILTTASTVTED